MIFKEVHTLYFIGVCRVGNKIKTSIVIDKELWKKFKEKIASKQGLRQLSKAVEEAIEEELVEFIVLRELEQSLSGKEVPSSITPVKPRVKTRAEEIVREMRGSRI